MAKYSNQAIDKVTRQLNDRKVRTVDGETENMIIDSLLSRRYVDWPPHWKSEKFSPTNNVRDAFDLLREVHPSANFHLDYNSDDKLWECFVVDRKYSVACFDLPRTIVLAVWNYYVLKRELEPEKIE